MGQLSITYPFMEQFSITYPFMEIMPFYGPIKKSFVFILNLFTCVVVVSISVPARFPYRIPLGFPGEFWPKRQ